MPPNPYTPKPDGADAPQPEPVNQPQTGMSTPPRIIQPISSEAEIRAASVAPQSPTSPPIDPPRPSDVQSSNVTNSTQQQDIANEDPYYTGSTLITEPLAYHADQLNANQSYPSIQPSSIETPKKKRKLFLPIFSLIFIAGIAGVAYLYFGAGKVFVHDLVEEKVQNTSYLRPHQWQNIKLGTTSSYGNKLAKDDKSTALVSVSSMQSANPALLSATDDTYQQLRTSVLGFITEDTITRTFQDGGTPCATKVSVQKEPDMSSTSTTVGVYKATATCERAADGSSYILKMRGVAGRDGRVRTVLLLAIQSNWDSNKDAYQKMLDSLRQTDSQSKEAAGV